ncbi:alkaline shock response membrane anchor protein AmaP [Streptomyces sp. ISL-22]|uniref:alkaline shock response membrane anchor protein AmaP n=1 Tax=unclassified Streptomyces TaxID=2593676 RepID=UPI001BE5E3D5|nr:MULTISPECIES: alkaline shock response membrane anchor protein AmaP [unclassified Streptomyces]MBT2420777.1 alkaline shock response membrane anchor protein AmaP [Streptomyces sp. ISL-24]MBT2431867.1 alkaline shock response membrane anchor protein AmaP [Streptomyces sp. ISL-22]
MTPRPVLNRILLALTGLVMLGGGLLIMAAGLDLYRRHDLAPPAGWPLTTPDDILLSSADRARWSSQGWWWWPAVIATLALITLLALWWLLAQLRRRHPGAMPVGGTPPQEGVELRDRALSDAIATEARALPDVQQADVRITGRPAHPRTHITLTLAPQGTPDAVLNALCEGPLGTAHQSTGSPRMPTEARLRVARHKPHRAQ